MLPGGETPLLMPAGAAARELPEALARCRDEMAACAAALTDSMELVTLLRDLGAGFELQDDRWQAAREALPVLAQLTRSEALLLVPAERHGAPPTAAAPAIAVGAHVLDEQGSWRLIEQFQQAARQQPVVRNQLENEPLTAAFPGVREFVLVAIAREGTEWGWLLALNRILRGPAQYSLSGCWGGPEFGTIEASMMEACAAILAAQLAGRERFLRERSM